MTSVFAIPSAGVVAYLFSSWVLMLFGGILREELGTRPFSYGTALLATLVLWIVIAPVAGAVARWRS